MTIDSTFWFWILFNVFIFTLIFLDIKLFHAKDHTISIKEALWATSFWVGLALAFNIGIYFTRGLEDALNFFTGYLIEYSLSIDNIFVFILIFSYFKVPSHLTHKVLFWGILGAILMRAIFIISGVALIQKFSWLIYIFGVFLIITGIKLGLSKDSNVTAPENNILIKFFKRFFPVTADYVGNKFFVWIDNRLFATPLFLVLLSVETTDLIFAIDSIPAIIGITTDFFIVYTSNIFAVLGLRSLYFALAGLMGLFYYLHYGLAIILVFIGLKMLFSGLFHLPIILTLGIVILVLGASILLSLFRKNETHP